MEDRITYDNKMQVKILISKAKALRNMIQGILSDRGTQEIGRYTSCKNMAIRYNELAKEAMQVLGYAVETFNIEKIKDPGDMVWSSQKTILEEVSLSVQYLLAQLESKDDFVEDEITNFEDFLRTRLRSVIFSKPEKEKEVQDAIETLLIGRSMQKGIDYNREAGKIEFSGKEFIPDFVITKMNLCIEVKLLREGRKSQIIEEICADITAYSKKYEHQLFVVYDLGVIRDETEFINDISSKDGVKVLIIKQ